MKRLNYLFEKIIAIENLQLADQRARKGKGFQYGIKIHDKSRDENIVSLHGQLKRGEYRTSAYSTFTIHEPKERIVSKLPYFPDRIVHHAIMNILEPVFTSVFTADTYSCIKRKGIHGAANAVKAALSDPDETVYCLKLDIRKFYPSIDHCILKQLLQRKFKDRLLLDLLFEIINSAPGIPIGNYLSQYFANFYLSGFDHWLKEVKRVKYYYRYADDIVILASNKNVLHSLFSDINIYMQERLKLEIKSNYQVFPVDARGIDFVGYVFRHGYTRIRKSIKQNFARKMATSLNLTSLASYNGWLCHCNSNHLLKKILNEKVQRLPSEHRAESFHWRQNQNRKDFEQADNDTRLQNRTIGFQRERERNEVTPGISIGQRKPHLVFRIDNTDDNDTKSIQERFSF